MRSPTASARLLRAARFLLIPLCLGACVAPSGCQKSEPGAGSAAGASTLAPVPAPEGLLGELFLPAPDATWSKARALVGGPAAFLPQSFGALAATLLKLPLTLAGEIDGNVPVLGAALKKGTAPALGAVGIHVRAGDRIVDQLTRGPEARFDAKTEEATKITLLSAKQPAPSGAPGFAIGVLGNYLLVAATLDDLVAAGPYVARTLPTRPAPKEDLAFEIPEAALGGPVLDALRLRWAGVRNEVDNANLPITPLSSTMSALLDAVADSKQARVTLELEDKGAHARFTLTPKPGDGAASRSIAAMAVGDATPLLDLPASTPVGVLWREAQAARVASATGEADALAKLIAGKEVPAGDREAIAAALRDGAEARGDWVTLALGLTGGAPGVTAKVAVADEEKMNKALRQLVELTRLPSVKARLAEGAIAVTPGKVAVEGLPGDVQRVRFERAEKDAKGKGAKAEDNAALSPSSVDLLYLVTKDALFAAVGGDPKEALRGVVKVPEGASLATVPAMKGALDAVGGEASFLAVADVLRIVAARAGKPPPAEVAPLVLALGKTAAPAALFGRLDVSAVTIQEFVKHRDALF